MGATWAIDGTSCGGSLESRSAKGPGTVGGQGFSRAGLTVGSGPEVTLSACRVSADLLGQPDENALGASDVAEPIHVFVLDNFVDELRAVSAEPGERIVEVVHGEHDTQVAQSVHRGVPVIGDHRRRKKSREFDPAVAVRRTHHGDLDALVAQSSDAP